MNSVIDVRNKSISNQFRIPELTNRLNYWYDYRLSIKLSMNINMNWKNKILKIVTVSSITILMLSQLLVMISQYCFCEPDFPQLEVPSVSDCHDEQMCCSDQLGTDKTREKLIYSNQGCTSYFMSQVLFFERKIKPYQKHTLCTFLISSMVDPSRDNESNNFFQQNDFLPYNRFINHITKVQLLI